MSLLAPIIRRPRHVDEPLASGLPPRFPPRSNGAAFGARCRSVRSPHSFHVRAGFEGPSGSKEGRESESAMDYGRIERSSRRYDRSVMPRDLGEDDTTTARSRFGCRSK